MRYRQLSPSYDYVFGQGQGNFYVDNTEAVAQAVLTRLRLLTGEWFLNLAEGLPLYTDVIGRNTYNLYDPAIKRRILGTQGVTKITYYSSSLNADTRQLSVQARVSTIYGQTTIETVIAL